MTGQEIKFIIILIINLIITAVYLIINLLRKEDERASCWIRAIVMLLCPLTGAFVLLVGYAAFHLFFHREVDLADVVFSKDRVKQFIHADEERERNIVSVEEAIEITDRENLRTLTLNVVRGDIQKSLSAIAMALDSEDSETAHYAASILQDALNNFRANVQKNYQYMKENEEERVEYAHMLIDYMNQVLKQQVFTDMEQINQVDVLEDVCRMLYEKEPQSMTELEFEAVSLRLLEISEYERSEKWCERIAVQYPNTLSAYTCRLKLYFSIEEKEKFFKVLSDLRQSNVTIDQETLEMIRAFL